MEITKIYNPAEDQLTDLNDQFWKFVLSMFPDLPHESEDKKFLFSIEENLTFIGGVSGNVYWDGLEIDTLWVDDSYRRRGVGGRLLKEAEEYAISQGAVIAFLKTVEAKRSYKKHGYEVYGELEDRPIGSVLYHMKKRLDG